MSVLIKGMEMPTSCFYCPFRRKINPDDIQCLVTRDVFEETFAGTIEMRNRGFCPLIEVPPHGRLIDADALIKDGWTLHKEVIRMGGYATHELPLNNPSIPTIIDAEEGE